ncbi:Trafficking protein particle complex subunit 6B [Halotydeus destructor]|nr:Trafficking protein particle complex subunit 6B [Halotydeus destructor]
MAAVSSSNNSNMQADSSLDCSVLLDLLHMEAVDTFFSPSSERTAGAEEPEEACSKLEAVGQATGHRLAERLTRDWGRFRDDLDTVKFVCKDFWATVTGKQMDNLRTNHQGVYVLLDSRFRFLVPLAGGGGVDGGGGGDQVARYLAFGCGLLRGALGNLGLQCVVTAEVLTAPSCRFQVQIVAPSSSSSPAAMTA